MTSRDQWAKFFHGLLDEFAKPGMTFSIDKRFVDGDTAFIACRAETADNVYELGTDTFTVREGNIVSQTYIAKKTPK